MAKIPKIKIESDISDRDYREILDYLSSDACKRPGEEGFVLMLNSVKINCTNFPPTYSNLLITDTYFSGPDNEDDLRKVESALVGLTKLVMSLNKKPEGDPQ